ncbi:MAG: hypothetical protein NT069_06560 [Planctomycetota bacterium]|nr:hypothetical protein [Planctomycetota bacterium]
MISAFKTWLRNLPWQMKWGTRSRRSLKSRGRRGSLPAVIEALESRVLLAAVSWTGNAGTGLWTTAGNWNGNQVPGANDDVTIDVPGSASVLLIGDVTVKSLANSETLTLVSNAIVNTKLTFQSGVNSGGTINLDSPRGDRTTSIVVTQGEFINSTDAHINVIQNGGGGRQITGSLTNYGTITVESGIGLTVNNAVSNFEMADGVVSGAGAVTIVGGTFHFTGGSVTGTLNLVDVASTVAESVTGVSRIDVYGTGSTLGANLSVSTTIRLQTDYTYNTTLTTLDGAENRGTIILDSTRGDRTAKLLIGGSQFVNAATGLIQSVVGAGGGRQIRGKLANRGRIDVVGGAYVDIVGTYVVAGGSISGNGYLINSTIEVTESPTAATIVTMYGSNTLATANLPNVDLHLQTDYTYNTTLTTVDGAANRGTITLDSSRTDRTSKLQVGGTHFVNAGTGVIQAVVGGGGGRQIAGTIQNEGQIAANFNLSIGSAAAHHINRGIIANLGATITFTGSSLDNQYGALIGGYGIVTTTGMTFTNNGILDLTRPSIVDVQVDPGVIRVVYTDDMNSTQVSNPANYSLMASGGDGIFDDSNSVNLSANISSVAWDSASKTATLVLSSPLPTDI